MQGIVPKSRVFSFSSTFFYFCTLPQDEVFCTEMSATLLSPRKSKGIVNISYFSQIDTKLIANGTLNDARGRTGSFRKHSLSVNRKTFFICLGNGEEYEYREVIVFSLTRPKTMTVVTPRRAWLGPQPLVFAAISETGETGKTVRRRY